MRILGCGESALLAELDHLTQVMTLDRALRAVTPAGVVDIVPAARTVLVQFDPEVVGAAAVRSWISEVARDRSGSDVEQVSSISVSPPTVVIPVVYDGEDLADVAQALRLTPADVVALHTGATFTVAFCGFAPGFAYLTGLPDELRVARRPEPRTEVPAGAVALADEFTAVYPQASPGGWQLLGHTDVTIFEVDRDPPALLTPGTRVRFVEVRP